MRNLRIFPTLTILLIFFLTSCKENPGGNDNDCGDGPPCLPPVPTQVGINAPSASTTYWDDEPIACSHNKPEYADKAEWLVNEEKVACVDGKLDTNLAAGDHEVTVRITDEVDGEEKATKTSVTITVNQAFSVTLDNPKEGDEYYVGETVECVATVDPAKYAEHLQITVGGKSCTGGSVQLEEAGELTARAWVTVDNRTEADELTVRAKQAIAGRVYPLTDQGVVGGAGFEVTLKAGGETLAVQTDADGSFSIRSDRLSELGDEEVALEVAASGDFYGSKAVLPASELLALVEADELGFILAPKSWQIRCGPLAGESTTIKLPEAFKRNNKDEAGSSFYSLDKVFGEYMYRSVPPKYRPLPTTFNEDEGSENITSADSAAFWQEADEVFEPRLCRGDLFTPATLEEVPAKSDGVHVWAIGAEDGSSSGTASKDSEGHITGGRISLEIDDFGTHAQRHEQGHILSFGHTSEWVGTMSVGSFPGDADLREYSADDVSHIQLYMDTFDLQFEEGISFGVLQWRRVFNIPSLPDN